MQSPDYSISTPENVDLHLELAGLGNRVLANLVDTLISYAICAGLWILVWLACSLSGMANLPVQTSAVICGIIFMLALLLTFAILFGYFVFFEGTWQGQTPGKKLAQIRVIDQNGQPINWSAVWLRNMIRVIDTGFMMIGLIVMIIDKNERRLGDLAGGTLVIKERLPDLSTAKLIVSPAARENAAMIDVGRVTPQEYELLVNFLKRRDKLARSQRPLVARQLETHFREKLAEPSSGNANSELFLEKIYAAYQSRAE
jgi:uncharacterized RDD family membrane protein YckC